MVNDSNSDYTKEIKHGISSVCKERDAALFVLCIGDLDFSFRPFDYHQKSLAEFCTKNNLDGLIVACSVLRNHASQERIEEFVRSFKDIPLVSIGLKMHGIHSVVVNQKSGLTEILDDLTERHRCRKFGIVGKIPESEDARLRTKTVSEYLNGRRLRFDERYIIDGIFTYQSAMEGLEEYYEKSGSLDFDALIALNDEMAFAAMDFCAKHKIKVPEEIRVTGFDDVARAAFSEPPLTTVNQHLYEQGEKTASIILDLIEKKKVPEVTEIQSSAVFRKTCGCADSEKESEAAFNAKGNGRHGNPGKHGARKTAAQKDIIKSAAEWLEKRSEFQKVNDFYAAGQVRMNLNKFRRSFPATMRNFETSAAAVVLYDEPVYLNENRFHFNMPERASVLASYDDSASLSQNLNEEPIVFDPRKSFLPPGLIDFKTGEYSISILSNCENQYGYLIYRLGRYESLIYSMMTTVLSHMFCSSYENSKAEQEARLQAERTARLNQISKTDELTGLLNRRGFMELGQQTIDISVALSQGGMVIFGDMDGLKNINDNYGHDAGDRAIKAEAEILKKNFRSSDIIGRLGGDEFVIVAAGLAEPRLTTIRENIDAACKAWNIVHGEEFELSISLGCKEFQKDNKNISEILKQADELLYNEKREKKNARHDSK